MVTICILCSSSFQRLSCKLSIFVLFRISLQQETSKENIIISVRKSRRVTYKIRCLIIYVYSKQGTIRLKMNSPQTSNFDRKFLYFYKHNRGKCQISQISTTVLYYNWNLWKAFEGHPKTLNCINTTNIVRAMKASHIIIHLQVLLQKASYRIIASN